MKNILKGQISPTLVLILEDRFVISLNIIEDQ
jgi:hypothetical protein